MDRRLGHDLPKCGLSDRTPVSTAPTYGASDAFRGACPQGYRDAYGFLISDRAWPPFANLAGRPADERWLEVRPCPPSSRVIHPAASEPAHRWQYALSVHGIPDSDTFAFIEGRVLEQLCFGQPSLILNFDDDLSITVEGSLGIALPGAEEITVDDALGVASTLVRLISDVVADTGVSDSRSISLTFGGGQILRLIDNSEQYESFQIRHGDHLIIV